jgi:hypothetical protein
MTPEQFHELSPRIVGRGASTREVDNAWHSVGRFPVDVVTRLIANAGRNLDLPSLVAACQRQEAAEHARSRAPRTCEHGHIDTPLEPCPECRPRYAAAAKSGADLCRSALALVKETP